MNFFEYEAELLDILYFTEVMSLRDMKEYWQLGEDIGLLDFRNIDNIELLYQLDTLKISCKSAQNTFQSLKRARNYILFLIKKNRLSGDLAKKIANIDEFYGLFSKDAVLKILYTAERYKECEQYYYYHLSEFADYNQACSIWQQILAKSGDYKFSLNTPDTDFDVCLSAMRYLWQKGAFVDAEKIAVRLEEKFDTLKAFQKAQFLNTKIRILRDMGKIKDTDVALNLFYSLLKPISAENPELFNDLKGKYLYNCSINYFIAGDFAKCITFCKDSLPLRNEKYPDPYIKLRQARCFIFQGNRKNYNSLMKEIQFDTLDNWAKSLYKTVEAEYARFVLGNTQKAERLIKESNKIESASGADTIYTDIALLYLYIQCGRKSEIENLLPTIKSYQQYVDGQLVFATAQIALGFLNQEYVDPLIFKLCDEFRDYPIFMFVSLYSLSKLFEQENGSFPDIKKYVSFSSRFSRKLLSAFDYQPKTEDFPPQNKHSTANFNHINSQKNCKKRQDNIVGRTIKMEKILIISALEKELQPILAAIDSPLKPRNIEEVNGRKYFIYEVSATLTVICTSFLGMGQINAALAVKEAISYYDISKIILTGICAGIDTEMKYGDIIISDQIVDYELAKIKPDEDQVRWNVYRSDFELGQSMKMFKSDNWFSHLKKAFPDPKYEKPNVYSGIVLSGNKVIADREKIKQFTKMWAKAIAVEMEASGIAATLHQAKKGPSFVMVKSICDFADSGKSDEWQEYASYVSATFVLDYIFTENLSSTRNRHTDLQTNHLPMFENQKLFSAISGTYNLSEINVLAFKIGIDMEDVGGTVKSEKIVELIKYCQRRNLLDKLIAQINKERDNLLDNYSGD